MWDLAAGDGATVRVSFDFDASCDHLGAVFHGDQSHSWARAFFVGIESDTVVRDGESGVLVVVF